MKTNNIGAIDIHLHIPDFDKIREEYSKNERVRDTIGYLDKTRRKAGEKKMTLELTEQDMFNFMDECGIEKAILHPLSTADIYGFDKMSNERVFYFAEKYPERFVACVELSPKDKASIGKLEKYVKEHDVKSVNMNPNFFGGFFYNDKEIYPYYEKIQELGLPIMIHTGPTLPYCRVKHNNPELVDDVAVDFPKLSIVIDHLGYPWTDVAYMITAKNKNVYIDLSATLSVSVASNPGYMKIELQKMLNIVGAEKILFGTDAPGVGGGKAAIDFIRNYKNSFAEKEFLHFRALSDREKEMILRENAKRLFKI